MIDFDAWNDALRGEEIDEILAVVGLLASGFIEENDTVDVVFEVGGGEEKVAIIATIVVGVGNLELVEFFVDAAARFVGGEDAFGMEYEVLGNELKVVGGGEIGRELGEFVKGKGGV